MSLIPALCTQCGASLEVDASQEAAVCPYCHTPFTTEKAINNYNTITNIGNLHADVVNLNDDSSRDSRVKSGETFINMGDYNSAGTVFGKLTRECPYDYRGWWGSIKVMSKNFTDFDITRRALSVIEDCYSKACSVAAENEKNSMNIEYQPYINTVKNKLDSFINNSQQKIEQINNEFNVQKDFLEKRMDELKKAENAIQRPGNIIGVLLAIAVFAFSVLGAVSLGGFDGVVFFIFSLIVLGIGAGIIYAIIGIIAAKRAKGVTKEISDIKNQLKSLDQNRSKEIELIKENIKHIETGY